MKIRQVIIACVVASTLAYADSASATVGIGSWYHVAAPMGQYEGFYSNRDKKSRIEYSCTGFSSRLDVYVVRGPMTGVARLLVDGKTVLEKNIKYYEPANQLSITSDVGGNSTKRNKRLHNSVISALAYGNVAKFVLPDGSSINFSLKGSKAIDSCKLFIS